MSTYAPALLVPDRPGKLRTIVPNGRVAFPLIVIDGLPSSGRSWMAAAATGDTRFGQAYWLPWGAGDWKTVHAYRDVPGADYLIVGHDGHFWSVFEQVLAVKAEAHRAYDAGEPPVMLIIDSGTSAWNEIKTWVYRRAAASDDNQRRLARDPHASLIAGRNLWNDGRDRYRALMTKLITFPGLVVFIVRADYVSGTDDNGQPTKEKVYKLDCHESLASDADVCITMTIGAPPKAWKVSSVHAGIDTSMEPRVLERGFSFSWLVFDVMRCDPRTGLIDIRDEPEPLALPTAPLTDDTDPDDAEPIGRGHRDRTARQAPPSQPVGQTMDWRTVLGEALAHPDPLARFEALKNLTTAARFVGAAAPVVQLLATTVDWSALLREAIGLPDPAVRLRSLQQLWHAAMFAQLAPALIDAITRAGDEAKDAVAAASAEPATDTTTPAVADTTPGEGAPADPAPNADAPGTTRTDGEPE